jgi:hypothetical protein
MEPGEMTRQEQTGSASGNGGAGRRSCGRKLGSVALALTAVLLLAAAVGVAKDKSPQSRTVSGTVFDEAENPIVGATVEMKDVQTGKVLDIYSQEKGAYQFAGLRFDHDYTVRAMYQGGTSDVRHVSSLDTRTRPVMNLTVTKPKK